MSDPKLSLPAPTSVRLEPHGNSWQLVIDLDEETALAIADRLFDYVDRTQRERQRRQAETTAFQEASAKRRAHNLSLGSKILDAVDLHRQRGFSADDAWANAAATFSRSILDARTLGGIVRRQRRRDRNDRIYQAFQSGTSNIEIARLEGVSASTVANVLRTFRGPSKGPSKGTKQ